MVAYSLAATNFTALLGIYHITIITVITIFPLSWYCSVLVGAVIASRPACRAPACQAPACRALAGRLAGRRRPARRTSSLAGESNLVPQYISCLRLLRRYAPRNDSFINHNQTEPDSQGA